MHSELVPWGEKHQVALVWGQRCWGHWGGGSGGSQPPSQHWSHLGCDKQNDIFLENQTLSCQTAGLLNCPQDQRGAQDLSSSLHTPAPTRTPPGGAQSFILPLPFQRDPGGIPGGPEHPWGAAASPSPLQEYKCRASPRCHPAPPHRGPVPPGPGRRRQPRAERGSPGPAPLRSRPPAPEWLLRGQTAPRCPRSPLHTPPPNAVYKPEAPHKAGSGGAGGSHGRSAPLQPPPGFGKRRRREGGREEGGGRLLLFPPPSSPPTPMPPA